MFLFSVCSQVLHCKASAWKCVFCMWFCAHNGSMSDDATRQKCICGLLHRKRRRCDRKDRKRGKEKDRRCVTDTQTESAEWRMKMRSVRS